MKNLLLNCRELVTDDVISRMLTPLACGVTLLTKSVPDLLHRDFYVVNKLFIYVLSFELKQQITFFDELLTSRMIKQDYYVQKMEIKMKKENTIIFRLLDNTTTF